MKALVKVHAAMSNSSNPSLILASTSVYRRELLERLGILFTVISPKVDETPLPGEGTLDLALRLAKPRQQPLPKITPMLGSLVQIRLLIYVVRRLASQVILKERWRNCS